MMNRTPADKPSTHAGRVAAVTGQTIMANGGGGFV
jgi:hypothetical protein